MNTVTKTHSKITLKTTEFTFTMNRSSFSCSGNLTQESFKNLSDYVTDISKGNDTFGSRFDNLTNQEVLNSLLVKTKTLTVGDKIEVKLGKMHIIGTILKEDKKFFEIKEDDGQISRIQKVLAL